MTSFDTMALPPYLSSPLGLEHGNPHDELMGGYGPG